MLSGGHLMVLTKCSNIPGYVKVTGALRHWAIMLMALHGCILSEIQAPPEKRQVFLNELQRVGTESAKVFRLLGSKVQKMEKLGPLDLPYEVHEAAEELQSMVDLKSYLCVNSEIWEFEKRQKPKVADNYLDINDDETYLGLHKSINETVIDIERVRLSRSLSDKFTSEIMTDKHLSRSFSGPMLEQEAAVQWPSRPYESLSSENACALSLSTF